MKKVIADVAKEVYRELGGGYAESVYENAMAAEFRSRNINYAIENSVEILYKGAAVGIQRLDFVIENMAVELKVGKISPTHRNQTASYMRTARFVEAMIICFPPIVGAEVSIETCGYGGEWKKETL